MLRPSTSYDPSLCSRLTSFFFLSPLYFDAANQAVLTSQSDQSVLFKRCVDLCIQTVFPIVLLACMFCFPCSLGNLLFVCFFVCLFLFL